MKATLEFKLPEETEEFEACYRGSRYLSNLEELSRDLRNFTKHGDPEDRVSWEHVKEWFWGIVEELE